MAGLIRRSFTYLEPMLFKKLYVAFVRPHLEYGNSVWSPYLRKHVNAIEKVQIRATKAVDGFGQMTYEERLRILDLPTLAHRRKRGRKHNCQIIRTEAADGIRGKQRNSFHYRTAATWNDLPRNVADSKSVDTFKSNIDTFWKEHPSRFTFDLTPYYQANNQEEKYQLVEVYM